MTKAKVKHIVIAEKIYIKKLDVEDHDDLISKYTYRNGLEFLSSISETETHYLVPSNSYHKLEWETLEDNRNFQLLNKQLEFVGKLRIDQEELLEKIFISNRARSCILEAKPAYGKTYAACAIIARTNVKTLVLVHTKLLFEQWLKAIKELIPTATIGKIGDGHYSIGEITIAIYISANNNLAELKEQFSMIIVDECHKCPAEVFSQVVNNINAKIKIGISATPRRKDGKHIYLTDYFSTHKVTGKDSRPLLIPSVKIHKTDFSFRILDPKRDWAKAMNKLCSDSNYIQFVADLANSYIRQGRCLLVLSDRVQMLKDLQLLIPRSICVIGESKNEVREDAILNAGIKYDAILTTKLFDEGISCHRLDTMIPTCPTNNDITLEQRIGRIERLHPDKQLPLLADIWLTGNVVNRQQKTRLLWYQSRGYNIL